MEYRRLGGSGLKVSVFSIGSWVTYGGQVGKDTARECLDAAIERGVNFIDNAEAYAGGKAEEVVGEVLQDFDRHQLVLSSKVFWGGDGPNERGLSRKHVIEACEQALKRLRTDYLDLYFCHRPDPNTPVEETALAMDILIRQGKVLYWGTSEWNAEQLQEAYDVCEANGFVKPQMEQPQYHMFHRERVERELVPHYEKYGLGTTTWSPLASGLLTGKYNDGVPEGSRLSLDNYQWLQESILSEDRIAKVRALKREVADPLGCSMAQLALAWAAKCPYVSTVITGASRAEQVVENLGALEVMQRLELEQMATIEEILGT